MPLAALLASYRSEVSSHQSFITRAFSQDQSGSYFLNSNERSFVTDGAFLRIFIAWESFLESAFIDYLLGQLSISGRTPTRYSFPPSDQHAREMLIGTQKYVDWTNPEIVRKLSKLHFENGDPINSILSSNQTDLFDLKTLRNAAAHMTSTTSKSLDALASRKLGQTVTNITVSDFILSADPGSASGNLILDGYVTMLDTAAEALATW